MKKAFTSFLWGFHFFLFFCIALNAYAARGISRTFQSDPGLEPGMLVSLDLARQNFVVKSDPKNVEEILGIVVEPENALLEFSSIGGTVNVVVSGDAFALVTNLNGDIQPGDRITASPIRGVGMKATEDVRIVGIAQEAFSDTTQSGTAFTFEGAGSKKYTTQVGKILVSSGPQDFSPGKNQGLQGVLGPLEDLAQQIAGKDISLIRTLLAFAIVSITLLANAIVLESAVRGGMISLGRNPLARRIIISSLLKVMALSILILLFGSGASYLILKV